LSSETINLATSRLEAAGYQVSFGKYAFENDEFFSSSIEHRLSDLHAAFSDNSVDAVLTAIGGYNAIQLLRGIDYELIENNPKILCGFSDITVLSNAIFAKTGLVTYSGPHFSSWGMKSGFKYTEKKFNDTLVIGGDHIVKNSSEWSDDAWYLNQADRNFMKNDGAVVVNKGVATGTIIGGHARCLAALQGTNYWPSLNDSILFLEEDEETNLALFDRLIESITLQPGFEGVRGIVIGRFQTNSSVNLPDLIKMLKSKEILETIPIIINVNFGHTTPVMTFGIGAECSIQTTGKVINIKMKGHSS